MLDFNEASCISSYHLPQFHLGLALIIFQPTCRSERRCWHNPFNHVHYKDDGGLSSGSDHLYDELEFLGALDTIPPSLRLSPNIA